MFSIELLPAQHGDCLWVEYGAAERPHRMLIDGGTPGTWGVLKARLERLPREERRLELLVVTHIDADHLGGALELLEDDALGVTFGDVWFNGFGHLPKTEGTRNARQGEALSRALRRRELPWNQAFGGGAVVLPEAPTLPVVTLPGAMSLTLFSPTAATLTKLRSAWERELRNAGLTPGGAPPAPARARARTRDAGPPDVAALLQKPFEQDTAEANGSSIAFLAEHDGRRCLFTGDAHPVVLMDALERWFLTHPDPALRLDALKVPHHGSENNLNWEFLYRLECPRYLISTDGGVFHHPDPEAIARLVRYGGRGVELCFSHRSEETAPWAHPALAAHWGISTRYPDGAAGLRVEL
jgi:beta-lactamase superfamily II metal-dependent hydrolase